MKQNTLNIVNGILFGILIASIFFAMLFRDFISIYWDKAMGFDTAILVLAVVFLVLEYAYICCFCLRFRKAVQNSKIILDLFSSGCELFPTLGLLGTVLGLLNTFNSMPTTGTDAEMSALIKNLIPTFAPALTTTVSGMIALIYALIMNTIAISITEWHNQENS